MSFRGRKARFKSMFPRNRSRETLVPLIQKYIEPNTTIISGCWKPHDTLGE